MTLSFFLFKKNISIVSQGYEKKKYERDTFCLARTLASQNELEFHLNRHIMSQNAEVIGMYPRPDGGDPGIQDQLNYNTEDNFYHVTYGDNWCRRHKIPTEKKPD